MIIEEFYQNVRYEKINRFRKEAILNFIKSRPNQLVLDVGCNEGLMGELIKRELPVQVHGIEISSPQAAKARQKLDRVFCFNLEADFGKWPAEIKNFKYDKIIISEVLEHLFYPEKLLGSLKNVLHDKTEIIITVPNVLFWKNRLNIFFGRFEYTGGGLMDRGHIHFFTYKSLKKMLNNSGYQITAANNFWPTSGTKKIGRFFPGLFAFQFILTAKNNE